MREISIQEAEALAGKRLDRRRAYATTDDGRPDDLSGSGLFEVARWSQSCSGCYEGPDLLLSKGSGCSECGYTGRVREAQWVPVPERPLARI